MSEKRFLFFENFMEVANKLPDDLRLKYYDAIMDYVFNGKMSEDIVINALITSIKPSLDKKLNLGGAPVGNNNACKNKTTENNLKQPKTTVVSKNNPFKETEIGNGNIETEVKKETVKEKKLGELGYVRLTDEQYTTLKEKYSNIDEAIEVLDTWLGTTGSKHRNKNHYAYFKQNSWVWERVAENSKNNQHPIEYALPKKATKEEIQKLEEARKKEAEEAKQRAAEAQRRSDFIKSKGYASVVSLIMAGKDVYDRVMAEYRQAQGF